MSWRGEKGAIEAANTGHDVVLSPGPVLYFDNLQSTRGDEQPGRLAVQTLADVYAYDPQPAAIDPARAHHVLGAQANLWSEYLVTPAQVEHALFPRMAALAEMTWSPKAARGWPGFLARLDPQMERYRRQGVGVADSAFAVDFTVVGGAGPALRDKSATVVLAQQAPYGTIRYTIDGNAPVATSPAYRQPLAVAIGGVVRAASFAPDGRMLAAVRTFDTSPAALMTRDSAGLDICPGAGIRLRMPLTPDAIDDGPAFNMNIFDGCWLYRAAPLAQAGGIAVKVGRLPRNFALRQPQRQAVVWRYNPTRFGTLMVRGKTCEGPILASLPLPDPATASNRFTLEGALPATKDDADLCLTIATPPGGPLYGLEAVRLTTKDSQ
jgi:hexosaminidase